MTNEEYIKNMPHCKLAHFFATLLLIVRLVRYEKSVGKNIHVAFMIGLKKHIMAEILQKIFIHLKMPFLL